MAEDLSIITGNKAEQYQSLIPQIKGLLEGEDDLVANMANVVAALKEQFGWFWVGFYVVKNNELVLAPFQGPVACTRIKKGRGVCGTSWAEAKTLIVPDVEKFPGHIACSSLSKSEIVVPVIRNNEVVAVLDVRASAYRLRLLNGSNSRIYKLAWQDSTPLTVIATDGGPAPLRQDEGANWPKDGPRALLARGHGCGAGPGRGGARGASIASLVRADRAEDEAKLSTGGVT